MYIQNKTGTRKKKLINNILQIPFYRFNFFARFFPIPLLVN